MQLRKFLTSLAISTVLRNKKLNHYHSPFLLLLTVSLSGCVYEPSFKQNLFTTVQTKNQYANIVGYGEYALAKKDPELLNKAMQITQLAISMDRNNQEAWSLMQRLTQMQLSILKSSHHKSKKLKNHSPS